MEHEINYSYKMSIRIKSDGFKVTVSDDSGLEISSKRVTASMFRLPAAEIESLLAPELSVNTNKIRIIFESDVYSFVPDALFDPNETHTYLMFQHKVLKSERVVFNVVPAWNTVNVFSIPNMLLNALMSLIPGGNIEHHMSVLLSDCADSSLKNEMHLQLRHKVLDIVLLQGGKLCLLNSYPCQVVDDYVYYVMNIVEQLRVDVDSTSFYLYEGGLNSGVEKLLSNYLSVSSR